MRKLSIHDRFRRFRDQETYLYLLQALKHQKNSSLCPHCQSNAIVRYGKYRDRQRYKCKNCERTFNDLTNTPLHWTHLPHKFVKFLECILYKYSLHTAALVAGIKVETAFYWRHKLIHALEHVENRKKIPQCSQENWKHDYMTFREGAPIPLPFMEFQKRIDFGKWMCFFDWIKSRYVNRYLAWFRFLENLSSSSTLELMKELLILSSSVSLRQTYTSLRQAS